MAPNDKAAGKPRAGKAPETKSSSAHASDLLTLTIDAKTGHIVKIESVDSTGAHHELSDEERASLAKERSKATVEAIIEQAFEAGVACVLGGTDGEDDLSESAKDAEIRPARARTAKVVRRDNDPGVLKRIARDKPSPWTGLNLGGSKLGGCNEF